MLYNTVIFLKTTTSYQNDESRFDNVNKKYISYLKNNLYNDLGI